MEREKLLAQVKAFQTYLKNYIDDIKSRPQTNADKESEEYKIESRADHQEMNHIDDRYTELREKINQEHYDLFSTITPDFSLNIRAMEHMYREISFILDTIANLNDAESKQSNFKPNNQPFTKDEVQIINNQLDDLQNKLIETLNKQNLSQEKIIPLIESVKSEISDLKAEATNTKLGRKDWKNQLINAMINLTLILSFSQEARNIIFDYWQNLFIYLQQHIFLLKS